MKLFFEGDFEGAEPHFRKSHQMSPSDVHLALNLASFYIFSANMTEATDLIEEVKILNPYGSDQQFYLAGLIEFLEDNFDQAISLLSKMLNPDLMSMFFLASAYFKIGNQVEATRSIAKLLKKPGKESILEELSSLHFKDKQQNKELAQLFELLDSLGA